MTYNVSSLTMNTRMIDYIEKNKQKLDNLITETGSQKHADMGLELGAHMGTNVSLHREYTYMEALKTSNSQTAMRLDVLNTSYEAVQKSAKNFNANLVGLRDQKTAITSLSQLAETELDSLISQLNTTVGGVSVFGGQNTDPGVVRKLNDPANTAKGDIETAFQAKFGFPVTDKTSIANITPADLKDFIDNQFSAEFNGTNWAAKWSSATDQKMTATLSDGVTIDSSASANQQGFRDLAAGYTMLTMFGESGLGKDATKQLIESAMAKIQAGHTKIIEAEAQNGAYINRVKAAVSDIDAKMGVVNKRINKMENVDMAQIALELNDVQTQLQANYQITSRISKLSILNYLR
ncbi:flagellar hook-associated family protein [Polycladidibacter hongkongensis]|uniref:flagellar hook-associated family protein n=1 Tax=Polycladidibacter hongkongensis TaxID=1647556 RepID=UPI0009E92DB2|nr:flagellar hook-associated family protein [Pseudovibrio hongkongensis]